MRILRTALFGCLFMLAANLLHAQDEVQSWDGKIALEGIDFKKEIRIDVGAESDEISVSVEGKVSEGNLKVKLYNPRGIRMANLNLCAGKGSTAKGTLTEAMDASPGTWVLKVVNESATGKVNIKVRQN